MQSAEIELKFAIVDPDAFQARLGRLGFHLDTPRTFEANTLYDTAERGLRGMGQILRLRQYGELWTLTHKRHPEREDTGARYKVRIETETHVDDGPAMEEILHQLGYQAVFRYEKYRSEWSFAAGDQAAGDQAAGDQAAGDQGVGHLVVDETAIGSWGELEGPTGWIDEMLVRLGVDPTACITDSYGKLFLVWKDRTGSSAEHLTFAAVANEEMQAVGSR